MKKERADQLVLEQGLTTTLEDAKRFIMAGKIYTNKELRIDTVGEKLPITTELKIKGASPKYVSRGGYKLEKAIEAFHISLDGKIMLDIGSSTGGFTDAALQHGAKLCYSLDVGTNQLVWKLRTDERVVVMEQTNFRTSTLEDFDKGQPEVASIDVSFISLDKILPVLKDIIKLDGDVLALVKPQFEARREDVGNKGVVRDPKVHDKVMQKIMSLALSSGFSVEDIDFSPITGGEGNIEYLMHLTRAEATESKVSPEDTAELVASAHRYFSK